jgi:hypothetical protein
MPARLPDSIKPQIIQQWLRGKSRNDIAADNGISEGAVTNILNEWKLNLGTRNADELREFALILKDVGISPSQCGLGFRMASILLGMGVSEDDFHAFILDVYNRCKNIGLSPENISSHLQDLIAFSTTNVMPLSKVTDYLNEKREEKVKLEEEIHSLNAQISALKQEEKNYQSGRDKALREKEMTIETLNWYFELKQQLVRYSIPIEDVSEFAKLVTNIREHSGYDSGKVIDEYRNLETLRKNRYELHRDVASLENSVKYLKEQNSALDVDVQLHNQTISAYNSLKDMGFGLNEFNFLVDTVKEIAHENGLQAKEAVSKLLSDVEHQYSRKVGFELKIQNQREELNKLSREQEKLRSELLLIPILRSKLLMLLQSGLSEQDIISVADIIEKLSPVANAVMGTSNVDMQSLISDLSKYKDIKSAVQRLTENLEPLKKETAFYVNQIYTLEQENRRIFSSSIHLIRVFEFVQGAVFSIREEIKNLVSIYLFVTEQLLKMQSHDIKKMQLGPNQFNEFAALSRSKMGQKDVPISEIKKDVKEAIEILINKISPNNDTLAADLLVAYNALME